MPRKSSPPQQAAARENGKLSRGPLGPRKPKFTRTLIVPPRRALYLLERTRQQQKLQRLPDNLLIPNDRDLNGNQSPQPE